MTTTTHDPATSAVRAHALLLAWYRDMGVDNVVESEPVDWLARGETRPGADFQMPSVEPALPQSPAPPGRPPVSAQQRRPPSAAPTRAGPAPAAASSSANRQFSTAAPDDATLAARAAASAAQSLPDLAGRLAAFDGCGLKATAKSLCFYRGAAQARLMIVGEAARADDDKAGKPFSGQFGEMLDKMLRAIEIDPETAHITNLIYWRPPGNRPPTAQEVAVCRPFFERQVEFVKPEIVVFIGSAVTAHFFDKPEGIMKMRGKWRDLQIGTHSVKAIVTLHPENMIKTPSSKKMVWRDLLTIDAALNAPKPRA